MAHILDLSVELLLCIASFCRQVDLLNISLTCHHLRMVTEPELYREYSNPKLGTRTFTPFLITLLRRPELIKHVRRLDLKLWDTIGERFKPDPCGSVAEFDTFRDPEPTEDEYVLLTEAAKTSGVIHSVFPYEAQSWVIQKVKRAIQTGTGWYEHLYDPEIRHGDIPYDRQFCQLLRAGLEDPCVVLLLAILPRARQLVLQPPFDKMVLRWEAHSHPFRELRSVIISPQNSVISSPIAFFNDVLQTKTLESFECHGGSSWWRDGDAMDDEVENPEMLFPLSLEPGSVHLRRLVLQSCAMKRSEMKTLLDACCQLKALYYSSGTSDNGPYNFTTADLIELLEPHKCTLEELYIDIGDYWSAYDEYEEEDDRIKSLSHFNSLKILDTSPSIWESSLAGKPFQGDNSLLLTQRLPASLEMLVFHADEEKDGDEDLISMYKLIQMLYAHAGTLPKLTSLLVCTMSEWIRDDVENLKAELDYFSGDVNKTFDFQIGFRDEGPTGPTWTSLDTMPMVRELPETRWSGNKYAHMMRKPSQWDRAFSGFIGQHWDDDLSDEELLEMVKKNPELGKPPTLPVERFRFEYEEVDIE